MMAKNESGLGDVNTLRFRLFSVAAIIIGSVPGFLLPVALVWKLDPNQSDVFLLALSISTLIGTITGYSYEASMLVSIGRGMVVGARITQPELIAFRRRATLLGIVVTVPLFPALCFFYGIVGGGGHINFFALFLGCCPLAIVAVFMCASSVWAGYLTARRRLPAVFFSSIFRGSPNLIGVVFIHGIFWLSLVYGFGEFCRYLYLASVSRRDLRRNIREQATTGGSEEGEVNLLVPPTLRSLIHQMTSMALSQAGPIVMRVFLIMGPAGTVSAGEVANRIYSGGYQLSNSGIVMPMVATFPSAVLARGKRVAKKEIKRGIKRILLANLALSILTAIGVLTLLLVAKHANYRFEEGLRWSLILLAALPFLGLNVWAARGLVLAYRTAILPWLALGSLCVTGAVAATLFWVIGPVAAILGILVGQVVDGISTTWILLRFGPTTFADAKASRSRLPNDTNEGRMVLEEGLLEEALEVVPQPGVLGELP
jgi:hypothetical protein